jgi:hypothetical protein
MNGLRFSIANLLAAVAVVGGSLAALNSSSSVKAGVLVIATLGVLLAAVLGVVYRRGEARAAWLGAAIFGWGYFAVVFSPALPDADEQIRVTLLAFRDRFWTLRVPAGSDPFNKLTKNRDTEYDADTKIMLAWPSWHHGFGATIHCVVTWLFALVGGLIGRWFYVTGR